MKGIQFRELVSKVMGKQESQIRTEEPRDCQKQETITDAEDGVRPPLRDPHYTEEAVSPGFAGRRQHRDITMADRKRERNPSFSLPHSPTSWQRLLSAKPRRELAVEGWGIQPVIQSTAREDKNGCPANRARTTIVPQSI